MSVLLQWPEVPVLAAAADRRRALPALAALLVLAGLGGTLLLLLTPRLVALSVARPSATGAPFVTIPELGVRGASILGYRDGAEVQLTLPVRNAGRLPVTVTSLALGGGPAPLLAVRSVQGLPLSLRPGASGLLTVTAVLGNCRYYTQRERQLVDRVELGIRSLGRSGQRQVAFDQPLMVISPTIVDCPGRTLNRDADTRRGLL